MSRITLDPAAISQLLDGGPIMQVCDDQGRVVGTFVNQTYSATYLPSEPAVTQEEIERIEREGTYYTTEEVLAHLRSL